MKTKKYTDIRDYGTLNIHGQSFIDYAVTASGLSLNETKRSIIQECTFEDLKIKKCNVGCPIFRRCRFRNVVADNQGLRLYAAAFSECFFSGVLRNVVIGFMAEQFATGSNAIALQQENIAIAQEGSFAIDFRDSTMENVAIRGEAIVPHVRFRRGQAVVLSADDLFEKLVAIGRSEVNRELSFFYLGTGAMPDCNKCVARIDQTILPFVPNIEDKLATNGITVAHYPEKWTPKTGQSNKLLLAVQERGNHGAETEVP